MGVYVDDMQAQFGRMVMCHMGADTREELDAMADRIGVARKWVQRSSKRLVHYDICLSKRRLAVAAGAVEMNQGEFFRKLTSGVGERPSPRGSYRDDGYA